MGEEKVLALITASEATKNELCSQLNMVLDGYMTVKGYATDTGIDGIVEADLIVLSSKLMISEAKNHFDPGKSVIVANRSLNMEHIDKLFHIKKGTEVLVVNDEFENSLEIIMMLQQIGIDYLNYIPYAPGSRIKGNAKIAITPGEVNLVPAHIETIIDIKARVIDITTIIEILSVLGLLDEKSRLISSRYMETIIRLNKQLHDYIEETASMNRYLVKVLNQVNDGIIAYSDTGNVTVFNEKSETIFGVKRMSAIGKNINQVIRDKDICDYLMTADNVSDQLFKIYDSDVIINKFRIEKMESTVCTLKNTRDTIDMEMKLRQSLIKKGYIGKYKFNDILGSSLLMRNTVETGKKLAGTDLGILISGESGVGKELFASAIHNSSARSSGPFLAVNFSSLSEELVESELFGYEEGSFTGASKGGRIGLFEQANGGTIFLDEIGDISLRLQNRLLRVLQEKEIRRVGGSEIISVNVRIVAATNKNLAELCRNGLFREDLYHRLRKLYLKIPPLRNHIEDMEELIDYFKKVNGMPHLVISEKVMEILRLCQWTGNIRELGNLIEYFIVVAKDGRVEQSDIPPDFFEIRRDAGVIDTYEEVLCKKGDLIEWRSILRAIQNCMKTGRAASRKTIAGILAEEFPYMTEDKIRRRTDFLQEIGLVGKSQGPGGMHLTTEGYQYLRRVDQ